MIFVAAAFGLLYHVLRQLGHWAPGLSAEWAIYGRGVVPGAHPWAHRACRKATSLTLCWGRWQSSLVQSLAAADRSCHAKQTCR